jgi:hypothetical protein
MSANSCDAASLALESAATHPLVAHDDSAGDR